MSVGGYTLREVDERFGRPKGSAFRAFKHRRASLREDVDFVVLPADAAGVDIERLRAAGCIYRSSVKVVILTESGLERECGRRWRRADGCEVGSRHPPPSGWMWTCTLQAVGRA